MSLEPTRVAEILKDRLSWYRDCRAVDVMNVMSTGNGGTIELLYMQVKSKNFLISGILLWDQCAMMNKSLMFDYLAAALCTHNFGSST